jgi:hypothetical protein
MPVLFPITELLFRLPIVCRMFEFLMPVADYVHMPLSFRQRYRWALMDTFDMLAPTYDEPQRFENLSRWLSEERIRRIGRLSNPGLNVVGQKLPEGAS